MPILRSFKSFQVLLVISMSLVFLTTIPSNGYCEDEWVCGYHYNNFIEYYNASSIKIDRKNHTIKVWVKRVFTENGKTDFLKDFDDNTKDIMKDINYILELNLLNYKDWKYSIIHMKFISKSGDVLLNSDLSPKLDNIIPNSKGERLFIEILKDYKIKR